MNRFSQQFAGLSPSFWRCSFFERVFVKLDYVMKRTDFNREVLSRRDTLKCVSPRTLTGLSAETMICLSRARVNRRLIF